MRELKVKKHIAYSYETTDGREFDDKKEAIEWQKHLCTLENMCMLDLQFKPTKEIECAIYVYAKTAEQAETFNVAQADLGLCAELPSSGFYRYDEIADAYVEVETEIAKLQHIIDMLKGGAE